MLHSCQIQLRGKKPTNPAYPAELKTLGDHLRKVRLDRGLSQPNVADVLKVSTDMVTCWELNRNQPTAKFAKVIIDFLGYLPFKSDGHSFGKKLYFARLITGKTQKLIAKELGCDESNLRHIELNRRTPHGKTKEKIQVYILDAFQNYQLV